MYSICYLDNNGELIRHALVKAKPAAARLDLNGAASLFVLGPNGVGLTGIKGSVRSLLSCGVFAALCNNDINNAIANIHLNA